MFQCTFAGNLTRDPEVKTFADGGVVANLSVPVNRRWKDKNGEKKEEVSYLDCDVWGATADVIARYFRKGDYILISSATIRTDTWEDKDSGKPRSKHRFRIEGFEFVPGLKKDADTSAPPASSAAKAAPKGKARPAGKKAAEPGFAPSEDDGEIPF
jgi:single-strand DNA-binding protein